jgi:RNA polymerase sigma-70 factor (ECF subfamily)
VSTTPTGGRAVSDPRAIAEVAPELHRRLRRRMGLMLYRHRIPPQDGEDLVQSSWLLAVARWPDIRDPESWLLGTLARQCIVYWRQRQLQAERYQPLDGLAPEPAIAPVQAQRDRLVDLGMAVRRLPLAQRRLLACRYRLGMSPPETAAALGLAPSTVRPMIHRARGRLWQLLGEERPRRTRPWHRARSQQPPAEPAAPSAAWTETVEAYLAASRLTPATRQCYRCHLSTAGGALGRKPLAELAPADLAAFRAALLADGRASGTQLGALGAVRGFLLWAHGRGLLLAVDADGIRDLLRGWRASARRRRAAVRRAPAAARDPGT